MRSSREKRPAEEPKASTSAVTREQIVSLRQQGVPTSEEYHLDQLPDEELADPVEVDAYAASTVGWRKIMRELTYSWQRDPCRSGQSSR